MVSTIYLDAASATPLLPEAREAFIAAADTFGDPLMIHGPGRRARSHARRGVARPWRRAIGAQPDEIVFTSGGTESVALAIWGGVRAMRELGTPDGRERRGASLRRRRRQRAGQRRVRARGDPGRRRTARWTSIGSPPRSGSPAPCWPASSTPTTSSARCSRSARRPGLAREAGVRFHTDACQTVGRLPVDVDGARRRSAVAVGAQVRRTAGRRGALRAAWGRRHRVSVR